MSSLNGPDSSSESQLEARKRRISDDSAIDLATQPCQPQSNFVDLTTPEPVPAFKILKRLSIAGQHYKSVFVLEQGQSHLCTDEGFLFNLPDEIKNEDQQCWLDICGEDARHPHHGQSFHLERSLNLIELSKTVISVVDTNGKMQLVVGTPWEQVHGVSIDWEQGTRYELEQAHVPPSKTFEFPSRIDGSSADHLPIRTLMEFDDIDM
jgi:hypothetical protein